MVAAALLTVAAVVPLAGEARGQETTGAPPSPPVASPSATPPPRPVLPEEAPVPAVEARAWALVDLGSGEFLAGENAAARLPMASTTKIMLALVALERLDLEEEVVVSEEAAAYANPAFSSVGLLEGDVLTVRELVMGAMISSGGDAAFALAEHLGDGRADRGVALMNRRARELGLEDTRFANPTGLDEPGHHASARDLAALARRALENPAFREIVATPYATVTTRDREIPLENTNDLLFTYTPTTGVKTGTTPAAGPCLVASAAAGEEGYVSVVLDDEDRFADSAEILEHGFVAHERVDLVVEGARYAGVGVPYRPEETVDLLAARSVADLVDAGSEIEWEAEVVDDLPEEAERGERLGTVVALVDGEPVGESPLVAREGYEAASLWQRVWYTVGVIFE